MTRVLRSSKAEEDLIEIWLFVASDSVRAADALLDEIDAVCRLLADKPHIGAPREELAPNLRSWPVGNYVVYYCPAERESRLRACFMGPATSLACSSSP